MNQAKQTMQAVQTKQGQQAQQRYRAPRECPVCAERLQVTQLGCEACGTGISGSFESCDFCALDTADLDVLRVFLSSRGNMKELERHLGVSYPTARARYDEMIRKLGLVTKPDAEPAPAQPLATPGATAGATDSSTNGSADGFASAVPSGAATGHQSDRLAALRALATGELDIEQARRLISGSG